MAKQVKENQTFGIDNEKIISVQNAVDTAGELEIGNFGKKNTSKFLRYKVKAMFSGVAKELVASAKSNINDSVVLLAKMQKCTIPEAEAQFKTKNQDLYDALASFELLQEDFQ
jgi:translation elongation factor P/translation initiation factor 5A